MDMDHGVNGDSVRLAGGGGGGGARAWVGPVSSRLSVTSSSSSLLAGRASGPEAGRMSDVTHRCSLNEQHAVKPCVFKCVARVCTALSFTVRSKCAHVSVSPVKSVNQPQCPAWTSLCSLVWRPRWETTIISIRVRLFTVNFYYVRTVGFIRT